MEKPEEPLSLSSLLSQDPIFDLSSVNFFGLTFTAENQEWEKFIDDLLLLRFSYFRICYIEGNIEFINYFLNLLEGAISYFAFTAGFSEANLL